MSNFVKTAGVLILFFIITSLPIRAANPTVYWGARIDGEVYNPSNPTCCDAPWDDNTWSTFESHTGKHVSIVHWGSTYPETFAVYPGPLITRVKGRGAMSLLSWSTSTLKLTDITAGLYDSFFQTWAAQAAAENTPFFLRLDWEMNGGWFPWGTISGNAYGNTAADYVAMWKHIHDIFTTAGANNVTWVWCPNAYYSGSTPLANVYPGDNYVDWVCFDSYNGGALKGGWQTFNQIIKPTYDQLVALAPNKPIMIAETASSETGAPAGSSKAAWISDALTVQLPTAFPKIQAFVWFNWNILENGVRFDWQIESSTAAQNAFAAGIADSRYATNIFTNLTNTKIPPMNLTIPQLISAWFATPASLPQDLYPDSLINSFDFAMLH